MHYISSHITPFNAIEDADVVEDNMVSDIIEEWRYAVGQEGTYEQDIYTCLVEFEYLLVLERCCGSGH